MQVLLYAVIATLLISLISLMGIFVLGIGKDRLEKVLFFFISFSTGSLMGGAFFHLLPESLEQSEPLSTFKIVLVGFIMFYILERILRWHHCHEEDCDTHGTIGYQNLLGDALHNILDGLIIVSAFAASVPLGISVTLSVALHEIPQEISDYGVLLYSGFSKSKAVLYNVLSALMAVVSAIVGYFLIEKIDALQAFLLPLAAGGFIYIAASDLIPELHKERSLRKSILAFVFFLAALGMMLAIKD